MTTAAGARRRTLKDGGAANPPELPEMESIIGYKLRRSQLYVFHDFIQSFAKLKLRPAEFSVLALIARTPGLKQSEVAEALGIKRANFVALMDGLEARGLASRRKGDIDKRSVIVLAMYFDDQSADALLTAAWLRANSNRPELWAPSAMTPEIARTEGWTFGAA